MCGGSIRYLTTKVKNALYAVPPNVDGYCIEGSPPEKMVEAVLLEGVRLLAGVVDLDGDFVRGLVRHKH